MKKLIYLIVVIAALGLIVAGCTTSVVPPAEQSVADDKAPSVKCTTIQSGELVASDGNVITTGYDDWGYNYQAHLFNGFYCDSYRDAAWCQPYKDVQLMMKWNDAWISNKDCDGDGLLDRHYGFDSYIGSGAWLTNHQSGEYEDEDGKTCKWTYFCKIVAAPADAYVEDGFWLTADGVEIGPVIWGAFAIVQQVENDACAGIHGVQYLSPSGPGFGQYIPHIPKYEFIETVEVPGTNEIGVDSFYDLQDGKDYLLKASGTYIFADWGEFGIADAEWSYRLATYTPDNEDGWIKGEGYFQSECGLDVQVDNTCVDWGDFSEEHEYEIHYIGTGNKVHFHIYDSNYGDNNGSIFVEIWRKNY